MLQGSCLCNSIHYEIHGEPGAAMVCHCSRCRKASGSAFAVNAAINSHEFHVTKGLELVTEFESSPGVFRAFCRQCGSPLYSRRATMPDILRLRVGTLDTPVSIKPVAHIFVASKAEWHDILDDVAQYEERP